MTMQETWEKEQKILKQYKATLIDHEFYKITARTAKKLCEGKLPRHGYEKPVEIDSISWWISRTTLNGKVVWSMRVAW